MRLWSVVATLLLLAGCSAKPTPATLESGDLVRPRILWDSDAWVAGRKTPLSMLVEIQRPGREEVDYLGDGDELTHLAEMKARVTFYDGEKALGEPLEVPFHRDC